MDVNESKWESNFISRRFLGEKKNLFFRTIKTELNIKRKKIKLLVEGREKKYVIPFYWLKLKFHFWYFFVALNWHAERYTYYIIRYTYYYTLYVLFNICVIVN